MTRALAKLALGLALTFGWLSAAHAQTDLTPPLLPGEVYLPIKGGCGVVQPVQPDRQKQAADALTYEWTGACWNGLINGQGLMIRFAGMRDLIGQMTEEYLYGRDLGASAGALASAIANMAIAASRWL